MANAAERIEQRLNLPRTKDASNVPPQGSLESEAQQDVETSAFVSKAKQIVDAYKVAFANKDAAEMANQRQELAELLKGIDHKYWEALYEANLQGTVGNSLTLAILESLVELIKQVLPAMDNEIADVKSQPTIIINNPTATAAGGNPASAGTPPTGAPPVPPVPPTPPGGAPPVPPLDPNEAAASKAFTEIGAEIAAINDPTADLAQIEQRINTDPNYFVVGNAQLQTDVDTLTARRTALQAREKRVQDVIKTFEANQNDITKLDRAKELQEQLAAVAPEKTAQKINDALFTIWEKRIQIADLLPELKPVREFVVYQPQNTNFATEARAGLAAEAALTTALASAESAIRAYQLDTDPGVQARQATKLAAELQQGRSFLEQQQRIDLDFWKQNTERIDAAIFGLAVALKVPDATTEAAIGTQLSDLEQLRAAAEAANVARGPEYQAYLETTYWQPLQEKTTRLNEALRVIRESRDSEKREREKYGETRDKILHDLEAIEAGEPGDSNFVAVQFKKIDDLVEELAAVAARIGEARLIKDSEDVGNEYSSRKLLFYHWRRIKPTTLTGNRVPPEAGSLGTEDLPLTGNNLEWLINHGLRDASIGKTTNLVHNPSQTAEMPSRTQGGRFNSATGEYEVWDAATNTWVNGFEAVTYTETQVGHVMRMIDDVYSGKVEARTLSGQTIQVDTIHENYEELLAYIHRQTGFDKTVIRNAFRLHWVTTLHQSYLVSIPEDSPKVADNFFYMYRWLRYFTKYMKGDRGNYLYQLTLMMYGVKGGGIFSNGSKDSVERDLATVRHDGVGVLETNTSLTDHRHKTKGWRNYRWLLNPLFTLSTSLYDRRTPLATGKRAGEVLANFDEGYCFATPLQFFVVKDASGKAVRLPSAPGQPDNRILTFDLIRDRNGDKYLYEMMPWESIGETTFLHSYMINLDSGPFKILKKLLKCSSTEAVKFITTPGSLNEIKNMFVYAVPFMPYIGPEIQAGTKEGGQPITDVAIHKLMVIVITAALMEKTDTNIEGYWTLAKAREFLDNEGVRSGVIDKEDSEVILKIIERGKFAKFMITYGDKLQENLKQLFKIK